MHAQQNRLQFVAKYTSPHGPIIYPFTAYLRYMASAHAQQRATENGWKLVSLTERQPK